MTATLAAYMSANGLRARRVGFTIHQMCEARGEP
jgi:hypothetical protein